jgi:hypothetical protein
MMDRCLLNVSSLKRPPAADVTTLHLVLLLCVAAALEKVSMDTVISNASPAALAQALNTIRTRPASVWPVAQVGRCMLHLFAGVPVLRQRGVSRLLSAVASWMLAALAPNHAVARRTTLQFGQMAVEEGYAVRWVPDSSFVSPCDGELIASALAGSQKAASSNSQACSLHASRTQLCAVLRL